MSMAAFSIEPRDAFGYTRLVNGILYDPPLQDWTREDSLAALADWEGFMIPLSERRAIIAAHYAKIGRKGGKIGGPAKTAAKVEAARINGLKGGRPRRSK